MSKRTILVAVDFSDASLNAARYALGVAKPGDDIHLVHVRSPVKFPESLGFKHEEHAHRDEHWHRVDHAAQEAAKTHLEELKKELSKNGAALHTHVVEGEDARHSLNKLIHALQADEILVGVRGNGGKGLLGLGSVSDFLVHHGNCSVTVVRPKTAQVLVKH